MRKFLVGLSVILLMASMSFGVVCPASAQTVMVVEAPWLGPASPWFWYNNAWWYNGVLYGFYGGAYGWRPYGSITNVVVEQPAYFYNNPKWGSWAQRNPQHGQRWQQQYHGGMRNPNYHPPVGEHHLGQHQEHPGDVGHAGHFQGQPQASHGQTPNQPGPVAGPAHSPYVQGQQMTQRTPIAGPSHSPYVQSQQQQQSRQPQVNQGHQGQPMCKPAPAPAKKSAPPAKQSGKTK